MWFRCFPPQVGEEIVSHQSATQGEGVAAEVGTTIRLHMPGGEVATRAVDVVEAVVIEPGFISHYKLSDRTGTVSVLTQ